jgi:hypothetical protein
MHCRAVERGLRTVSSGQRRCERGRRCLSRYGVALATPWTGERRRGAAPTSDQIIDALTGERRLVTSGMVPAVTAVTATETCGGPWLADHDF